MLFKVESYIECISTYTRMPKSNDKNAFEISFFIFYLITINIQFTQYVSMK